MKFAAALLLVASAAHAGIVDDVRAALARNDFASAGRQVEAYRKQNGETPEMVLAVSWMGRAALAAKQLDRADTYAAETRKLALEQLKKRGLDADKQLPLALGASIEVHAQALAQRGERDQAVRFLQQEVKAWWGTSIRARIQKNLNLLTLEGKPAPPLSVAQWFGERPEPVARLKGHAVVLFFWAHWCPDCKAEAGTLARLRSEFSKRGLVVMAPTQHYGYVAGGEEAAPDRELAYIRHVWRTSYGPLAGVPVPVSEENFKRYGSSTTPTLVLIDGRGVVRLYHPGPMSYEDLRTAVEAALNRP